MQQQRNATQYNGNDGEIFDAVLVCACLRLCVALERKFAFCFGCSNVSQSCTSYMRNLTSMTVPSVMRYQLHSSSISTSNCMLRFEFVVVLTMARQASDLPPIRDLTFCAKAMTDLPTYHHGDSRRSRPTICDRKCLGDLAASQGLVA
jgi:hypothetical protein